MHVERVLYPQDPVARRVGGWGVAGSECLFSLRKSVECGYSRAVVLAGFSARRFAEKALGTHWLGLGSALVEPWERLG